MLEYIEEIIIPYVENQREALGDIDKAALVIMDNFRGQTVTSVNALLEEHNIHVVFLPPNTTDMLQPMDVAVNKPAKDFLKRCFEQWYYEQIANQLAESDDLEDIEIQPVDLRLQTLKEWG